MAISSLFRSGYALRLFLWLLGYSLLILICFVWFQYGREKQFKAEELNARLQAINAGIIEDLTEEGTFDRNPEIRRFDDLRISVIDAGGNIVYDNSLDSLPRSNHLDREEIAEAVNSGEGYAVRRHSESTGGTYFYSARQGRNGYIVRTAVPYSLTLAELLRADYGFLWFMGGVTLLMCTLGYFATRRMGQTITRLKNFAQKAERGEQIYDSEPFPNDELGGISNHIVRLYARLQRAIVDRDREHQAALVQEQEKIRIKKQLTNNINHELKTPLAAIQVCVETLTEHPDLTAEKRAEFLGRCNTNIQRLRRLLDDVSTITRMDDGSSVISKEPLDLSVVIADVCSELELKATGREIAIVNEVHGETPLTGNLSLLSSVFHNLIDNAISYSGGTEVRVRLVRRDERGYTLTVADNGTGVDPQHLPRLFERFYRIDKGRSRRAGGTGLGLAIVKNALLIHGGSITVSNQPSGGLIFTLYISKV